MKRSKPQAARRKYEQPIKRADRRVVAQAIGRPQPDVGPLSRLLLELAKQDLEDQDRAA